jgi:hypothetical protein
MNCSSYEETVLAPHLEKIAGATVSSEEKASSLEQFLEYCVSARCGRWMVALSLLVGATLCAVVAKVGLPQSVIYGHDIFIQFDGAWRVMNGQRPHVDFYSGFGPVTYWTSAIALKFVNSAQGLVWSTVSVGLALTLWTVAIVRGRMTSLLAIVTTALLTTLWLAPFPIGEAFYMTSYAMQYNRLGYVLLGILLIELYLPCLGTERKPVFEPGAVSSGVILGLLLFLKVNFFMSALPFVAAAYVLEKKTRRHFCSLAGGFTLVALPILIYLHWDVVAMLSDLRMAAAARRHRFTISSEPLRTLIRNAVSILIVPCFGVLAYLNGLRYRPNAKLSLGIFVVMILGADTALTMSNTQRYGYPLSLLAILILAQQTFNRYRRQPRNIRFAQSPMALAVMLGTLAICLPTIGEAVNGFAEVHRAKTRHYTKVRYVPITAGPVADLRFLPHFDPAETDQPEDNGSIYTTQINEGLELIRSHSTQQDSVICLCFSNPFSYSLQRPPAEGGATFFDYGTNFTDNISPPASRILGDAKLVIYPKESALGYYKTPETLLEICKHQLAAAYHVVGESEHWVLLKHN